ncbi:preprotein translocase subunit SecG [Cupriavidus sp. USMAHM13]|uniref:Protein-export membrane protein SecG n=1 Tax=Cupriavidus malaysiensis TaxID=367825 RepID=A0ABN4TNC5_9BURK|nr:MULTISPECIES: preprotein translocase subunit SecG [Cupriavidus]AOY99193.1 preprotein translocase subunit SecG [Cupriavidus sp. USMAHM13]AOZ05614.1 preprotein translocase subunit SecG [Cupriavidus malaysiensis]
MAIFKTLLVVLQVLSALGVIGLVLLQHGKGADVGAAFGSGASGSLFGATGSANFLSRTTAVLATVFFACTLALTLMTNYRPAASLGVMGAAPQVAPAAASAPAASAPAAAAAASAPAAPAVPK